MSGSNIFTSDDIEQIAKICRTAYQGVGISSPRTSWDQLPEHRREPHRIAAQEIYRNLMAWDVRRNGGPDE